MKTKLIYFFPLLLLIYSVYSFSQTTPNLVISSNSIYWQFQQSMWQLGYHMRPLSSLIYGLLIFFLFISYFYIIYLVKNNRISLKQLIFTFALSIGALLPSYPGLSNDVFNYLMNAKMMHVYGASPYKHAAWDFPSDPWLKFMMNVHTTTPYGYIWTGIGFVVYWITLGDLQFGMLGFRMVALISVAIIGWSVWILTKKNLVALSLICLNPLVLIEAIGNAHNDITMMAFFMGGIALYTMNRNKNKVRALIYLAILWLISVYTKLITLISPLVYMGYLPFKKYLSYKINVYDVLAVALVVVMYADGAKRFFSWYLLWSLPVMVLAKYRLTKVLLLGLSFGGMLSYLPYLYTGEYTQQLGNLRYAIFFVPGILFVLGYSLISLIRRKVYEK